jgi:hypothetical protein
MILESAGLELSTDMHKVGFLDKSGQTSQKEARGNTCFTL